MNDAARVKRILAGDKAAAEIWVAESYPDVERMLLCLVGDPDIVADLAQQTFVKAWRALDTYRGEARLRTWMHRIAYHEYTHWLRDRRPTLALSEATAVPDPQAVRGLQTLEVANALAQLSDELRDTFLLFHVRQLSLKDVAAVQGIPTGTVKSRLFAARRALRELLGEPAVAPIAPAAAPVS